jgi:hypothetical protein
MSKELWSALLQILAIAIPVATILILMNEYVEPRGLIVQGFNVLFNEILYIIRSYPLVLFGVGLALVAYFVTFEILRHFNIRRATNPQETKSNEAQYRSKLEIDAAAHHAAEVCEARRKIAEEYHAASLAFMANVFRSQNRERAARNRNEKKSGGTASPGHKAKEETGWWTVLGVDKNASKTEIRRKFLDKIRLYHPDFVPEGKGDIAMLCRLNDAYQAGCKARETR